MVFVERDHKGLILRVEQQPFDGMTGELAVEDQELQQWLRTREEVKKRLEHLRETDLDVARVLEDLVCVLVEKGVIQYTDLPQAARNKLDSRAMDRADIEGLTSQFLGK